MLSDSTTISGLAPGLANPRVRLGSGLMGRVVVPAVEVCSRSESESKSELESSEELELDDDELEPESESEEEDDDEEAEEEASERSISTSPRSTSATGMFAGACPWLSNTPKPRFCGDRCVS